LIYVDNSYSIGRTPLVRLNRIANGSRVELLAKVEGRNPAYSVKCRIAAAMVWDAEKRGRLKRGMELIEPTSGNTGIALASVAAARGYCITLLMPETMSLERRKILTAMGAKLILTSGAAGMSTAIARAEQIAASDPERFVLLQQFQNPANPEIHFQTTGPEIWKDTGGNVDVFVSGVGTGGTITGVSRYFKIARQKPLLSVGVEPEGSPVISQILAGEEPCPGPHSIQGLGAGFIPATLDLKMVDRMVQVGDEEAMEMTHRLSREEGL
jgi:cysteine synthase A